MSTPCPPVACFSSYERKRTDAAAGAA